MQNSFTFNDGFLIGFQTLHPDGTVFLNINFFDGRKTVTEYGLFKITEFSTVVVVYGSVSTFDTIDDLYATYKKIKDKEH